MPLNITITQSSGPTTIDVPEDVAHDLQTVYEALKELPVNNMANVDFDDAKAARLFVKQGKAWAEQQGLQFARRGVVKDNPKRVSFRVYDPKPTMGRKPNAKKTETKEDTPKGTKKAA